MADVQPWSPDERAKPLFLVVTALLLMGGLLGVSAILSRGDDAPSAGVSGPGGRYQPAPMLPQSPVDTCNPAGNPPPMTIIQDTREFLHRLPLDRNTPKGWSNPVPKKP